MFYHVLSIHCPFPFVWHSCSFDAIEHSIEKFKAYKTDIQPSKGVVLLFSLHSNGVFLLFPLYVCDSMLWHVPCLFHSILSLALDCPVSTPVASYLQSVYWHILLLWYVPLLFWTILPYFDTGSSQSVRTILNTEFIEYIYCGCLLFHPPFDVFLILFSMSFPSFTQTFTGAPNIAFIISNICNFVNLSVFIPIHTYIYHKLPFL